MAEIQNRKPFRFILLGAAFDTGNMGVAALASGTVAAVAQSRPGVRIYLLDYGKEPATYRVKCPAGAVSAQLINMRFSKKVLLPNNIARLLLTALSVKLIPSRRLRERVILRNPYLQPLYEADMIGAIAGGDSFSDIYGLGRLLYVSLPEILILALGKPLVLLPQTIGPFKGTFGKAVARFILCRAEKVYSRDQTGLDEVKPLLGTRQSRLEFSYDVGFALEPERPQGRQLEWIEQANRSGLLVGLNVSGLLLMGGYNKKNMFGLKTDYRELIHGIIKFFVQEAGGTVLLVPHVFGDHPESDAVACMKLYQELEPELRERVRTISGNFNQHEIKYIIGQCDFFLGSRMHACIAALSQSVPPACLAYSRKFIGVMESVGCGELVADMRSLDNDEVLASIRRTYDSRVRVRDYLQKRMPEVKDGVVKLFSPGSLGVSTRREDSSSGTLEDVNSDARSTAEQRV